MILAEYWYRTRKISLLAEILIFDFGHERQTRNQEGGSFDTLPKLDTAVFII